jgi:putative oxygen-independent coproporphyrinogen III oxidase
MPSMQEAMLQEIELRKDYLEEEPLETIYFGGGTPSLLPVEDLSELLNTIHKNFSVSQNPEITLEANPDDLNPNKLKELSQAGINRLSIGVQSFRQEDLKWLKRIHNEKQALSCIENAKRAGFDNLTIDLIYGIPGQTLESWQQNLSILKSLDIPHFSAYSLTVEPKTALSTQIKSGKLPSPDDELSSQQFLFLQDWCETNGYEAYEISNYARPGKYSRHNSGYWQGRKYLGIGPSAHSYDGTSRQWNIANNALYIKALQNKDAYFEKEILTSEQQLNEYIMTALRTSEGIQLGHIKETWGQPFIHKMEPILQRYIKEKLVQASSKRISLTKTGKLWADRIAADLFVES